MIRLGLTALLVALTACSEEGNPATDPDKLTRPSVGHNPTPIGESKPTRQRDLLLKALPRDTLVAAHLPDTARAWSKLAGTVYGALIGGVDVVDVTLQLRPWYDEFRSRATVPGAPTIPRWSDVKAVINALDGEYMISLLDLSGFEGRTPRVRALAGITVYGAGTQARRLVQMLVKYAAREIDANVERRNNVWRITSDTSLTVFEVGVDHDVVLIGVGRDVVAPAMRRMRSSRREYDPLTTTRCFRTGDLARLHVNLAEVINRYVPQLPKHVSEAMASLRLDRLRGFSTALRIDKQTFTTTSFLDSPGGYDIITRMIAATPVDYKILEQLPPALGSFALFTFSPSWILRNVRSALPPSQANAVQKAIESLLEFGLDLTEAKLAAIGPQCAQIGMEQTGEPKTGNALILSSITNSAWLFQINRVDVVHELLNRLGEVIPTRQRYRIGEAEAITFDLGMPASAGVDISPSFAITPKYVYFALSHIALRRALEPATKRSAEEYRDLLAGLPESVSSVTYDRMLASNMFGSAIMTAVRNSPARQSPLYHKFRLLESALKNLSPAMSYTVADDSGIFSRTDSPTGSMSGVGGITGVSVIASIAIPNLLKARSAANESAAIAMIASIRTAQEQYRLNAIQDRDGDEDGEYGFMSNLMKPERGEALLKSCTGSNGRYLKNGYIFRVFLPGRGGIPVGESRRAAERVEVNLAERYMLAMAWPVEKGKTGQRSFILNTNGEIFFCADGAYGGRFPPPADILCFEPGNMMSRALPNGVLARDGLRWYRVR